MLVVGDRPATELATALTTWQGSSTQKIEVHDASGIPCGDALATVSTEDPDATTCAGWVAGWSPQLIDFDPDVVLVAPAWWNARRLLAAGGSDAPSADDPGADTWLRRRLSAATDLLSSRGAIVAVVEYPHPQSAGGQVEVTEGVRSALRALRDVAVAHPASTLLATAEELGAENVGTATNTDHAVGRWPSEVADILMPRLLGLNRGRSSTGPVRVMVVGDSVSWFVGRGLERWSRTQGTALVWNTGIPGCGIARGGEIMLSEGPSRSLADCDSWAERWSAQLEDFDPDVVVVLSGLWDLTERRLDEWHDFHSIGEPVFDRYLIGEYEAAAELLVSRGAQVIWLTAPCYAPAIFPGPLAGTGALSPDRQRQYNARLLPDLADQGRVQIADLAGLVCPDGSFTQDWGGLTSTRPDGVHFSEEATDAVAAWLGPRLVEASG